MTIMTGLEYVGSVDPWTDEERLTDEEIVRCRNCRHSNLNGLKCHWWMTLDAFENPVPSDVAPNGFCAWGVRRNA